MSSASQLPELNQAIEFEWLGTVFTGEFEHAYQPWNTAWLVHTDWFDGHRYPKVVSTNHVGWWRPQTQERKA
jgi:hypothetical protein